MPSTIPYDPSLVLGNLVPLPKLKILEQIATVQAPVDAAQDELNDAILTLRSLTLTMDEMGTMKIDTTDLGKSLTEAKKAVSAAAANLVKARLAALPQVAKLRGTLRAVTDTIESPIDYNKSALKMLPLGADSIKLDAQYFSFEGNEESATNAMEAIKSFVSEATEDLGTDQSMNATASVQSQISKQRQHHDIQGTLIITCACTHKQVAVFAPFVLDVDKAIRVWNKAYPGDLINPQNPASLMEIALRQDTPTEKSLTLLSGVEYGSSFIGMVHVLQADDTTSTQTMMSAASSIQAQMETGLFFAGAQGGFGVDASFAADAKRLLSTQKITSHVSMVVIGNIPSIKSNSVKAGVQVFAEFDAKQMGDKLATLQNATTSEQKSVEASASAARTGAQLQAFEHAKIESVMTGLANTDERQNQMLDVNSLMQAMQAYVDAASGAASADGTAFGAPINYFLKPITASQLAQMWVAKYYPGKFLTAAGDDTTPVEPTQNTGQPQAAAATTGS